MSTTLNRDVAMGYAAGDGSRMGLVLEVRQGAAAGQKSPPRDQELRLVALLRLPPRSAGPQPSVHLPLHPSRYGQPRRQHLVALAVRA